LEDAWFHTVGGKLAIWNGGNRQARESNKDPAWPIDSCVSSGASIGLFPFTAIVSGVTVTPCVAENLWALRVTHLDCSAAFGSASVVVLCLVDRIVPPDCSRVSLFVTDLDVVIARAVDAFEVPALGVVASEVFAVVVKSMDAAIGREGEEAPAVTI
jgi:hypothetical protein